MLNFDDVRRILELVREHELTEFELEQEGFRIRVRKDARGQAVADPVVPASVPPPAAAAPVVAAAPPEAPAPEAAEEEVELAVVKSPIVGTFYRSSEPGAPPFVEVGSRVRKGQVLCIIEAMKLMNEIESEYDGEVVRIYVENGQPVQYGERLFAIRTS
ncbi:MAG TPA: acetyl-CoA carboxylase biotin carboxyl carrier protein [Vicinamibacterales bacterium]|nr:acetyl-CoA carboxylase biotin carboxyl carrier protein [Vicinamibacterales bacterium]